MWNRELKMNLKTQRDIGLGLISFGVSLMTGFSLSAYGYWILFMGVVLITGIILGFLTLKEAVQIKAKNPQLPYTEAIKISGGFLGLIFLGFLVVVILGILRGF